MIISCLIALILIIWFRTDAWVEYCQIFHIKSSFYKEYLDKKKEDATLTYLLYLRAYHNCFFVRLITCPVCMSVWLGIVFALFTGIVMFPVYVTVGLLLYAMIDHFLG